MSARLLVASVGLIACSPPASPVTPKADLERQASAIVERQIAALVADDASALAATFDPSALFMRPAPVDRDSALVGMREVAFGLDPRDTFEGVEWTVVTVRGTARAIWIDFDLDVRKRSHQESVDGTPDEVTVRGSELVTASSGWRVVASSFSRLPERTPRAGTAFSLEGATPPGPLARLLDEELSAELVVMASREVVHAEWGIVQALVDGPHADGTARYAAFLVGLPDGVGWRALGVHVYPL